MRTRWVLAVALALLLASCGTAFSRTTDKVDINHATLAELEELPGMTPSWAQRIVRFRPYRTKLDLVQEGVVPMTIYRKIREGIIAHHEEQR